MDTASHQHHHATRGAPPAPGGNNQYKRRRWRSGTTLSRLVRAGSVLALMLSLLAGSGALRPTPARAQTELPDLTPTSLTTSATDNSVRLDEPFTVYWNVENQGAGLSDLAVWSDAVWLSSDATLSSDDTMVLGAGQSGPLDTNHSYNADLATSLASSYMQAGNFYLILQTDASTGIVESDETDNTLAVPFTVTPLDLDLAPTVLTISDNVIAGEPFTIDWTVKNQGNSAVPDWSVWSDEVLLSNDQTPSDDDLYLGSQWHTEQAVGAGATYSVTLVDQPMPLSVPAGNYYLLLKADNYNIVAETNEDNNLLAAPITVTAPDIDLAPTALTTPESEIPTGGQLTVNWSVANQGTVGIPAENSWRDMVYLSTDNILDQGDFQLGVASHGGPLSPSGSLEGSSYDGELTAAADVPPGSYYALLATDAFHEITEANEDNNVWVGPQITVIEATIDLAPTELIASETSPTVGVPFSVNWTVANQGNAEIEYWRNWHDEVFLSSDATVSDDDMPLGGADFSGPVSKGATYPGSLGVMLPPRVPTGDYYLILRADDYNNLLETDEGNNVLAVPISVTALDIDLIAADVSADKTSVAVSDQVQVSWTVQTQGTADLTSEDVFWSDRVYLSRDNKWDENDYKLAATGRPLSLTVGDPYTWQMSVDVPLFAVPGDYYLLLRADAFDDLAENSESNNLVVSSQMITITPLDIDLTPTSLTAADTDVAADEDLMIDWTVANTGTVAIPEDASWEDRIVLSTDQTLSDDDRPLDGFRQWGPVPADGGTYQHSLTIPLPYSLPSGHYYLLLRVDDYNDLSETNEDNNVVLGPEITVTALPVDLVGATLTASSEEVAAGGYFDVEWSVKNQGAADIPDQTWWNEVIVLSTDQTLSADDLEIAGSGGNGPLAVGATSETRFSEPELPAIMPSGQYHLLLVVDREGDLAETDETNNVLVGPAITVTGGTSVDLTPTALTPSTPSAAPGDTITVNWTAKNQGPDAIPSGVEWPDALFLSTDQTLSRDDHWLDAFSWGKGPLTAGESYDLSVTLTVPTGDEPGPDFAGDAVTLTTPLPAELTPGTYYLLLAVDDGHFILETNETNNVMAVPFTITGPNPAPMVHAGADATIVEGGAFSQAGSFSDDAASTSWTATVDYGDGSGQQPLTLNEDKTFSLSHSYALWGDYTVTVRVTDDGSVVGTDIVAVTVNNVAPTVNAGDDATVVAGATFSQSGSFSDPGTDSWSATVDYGDDSGEQPLTLNPDKTFSLSHTYAAEGSYTVTVNVVDSIEIGSDTLQVTVTPSNTSPEIGTPAFAPPSPVNAGTQVTLTAPFTDANTADTHAATVNWDDRTSGDMQVTESDGSGTATASHTYGRKGNYTVTVTVTDSKGASVSKTATIQVLAAAANVAPVANPGGPYTADTNGPLTLDGSGSSDSDGNTPLTYAWDTNYSGSGFHPTLTGANPTVTYSSTGTYTIALQVTDSLGKKSTIATTTVTVTASSNAAPQISTLTASSARVPANTPVTVTALFTDGNAADTHTATVTWGDAASGDMLITESGGNGTAVANHTYTVKGRYTVTVTVTDGSGATATKTMIIQVIAQK